MVEVPVYVDASAAIWSDHARPPMLVEFVPNTVSMRDLRSRERNTFMLPSGHYQVRFWSQYWFWRVGRAEVTIDVRSGQPVHLHYAAPYTIYTRGVAGFGPLPAHRPGAQAVAVIVVIAGLFPLAIIGIAMLYDVLTT